MYLIIGLTLGIPLIATAAGIWFCTKTSAGAVSYVMAGICFLLAWALRPRLGRVPNGALGRHDAPALFAALDFVADRVNSPKVEAVHLEDSGIASIGAFGLRGRRVVTISVVYAAVLTPLQLAGVLAHELGHASNGDPGQGRLVYVGLSTLEQLRRVLRRLTQLLPTPIVHTVVVLTHGFLGGIQHILIRLTWWERQCAELRADLAWVQLVGLDAFVSTFAKFEYSAEISEFVRGRAHAGESDLLAELRGAYRSLPGSAFELAQMRWRVQKPASGFDATHPPKRDRVAFARRSLGRIQGVTTGPTAELEVILAPLDDELERLSIGRLNNLAQKHRADSGPRYV